MEDQDIRASGGKNTSIDVTHDKMEGLATGTFIFVQLDGDVNRRFARMWDAVRENSLWYTLTEIGLIGINDMTVIELLEHTYMRESQNAAKRITEWAEEQGIDVEEFGLLKQDRGTVQ